MRRISPVARSVADGEYRAILSRRPQGALALAGLALENTIIWLALSVKDRLNAAANSALAFLADLDQILS